MPGGRGGACRAARPPFLFPAQPRFCFQFQPQEHRRVGDPELVLGHWCPGAKTQSCHHRLPPKPWLCGWCVCGGGGGFQKTYICVGVLGATVCGGGPVSCTLVCALWRLFHLLGLRLGTA